MHKHTSILIVSAALIAGLSGIARADNVGPQGRHEMSAQPSAHQSATKRELAQRKLLSATDYAQAGPAVAKPTCSTIACGSYVLIGVGF